MLIRTPSLVSNADNYDEEVVCPEIDKESSHFLRQSSQYVDKFINYDGFENSKDKNITVCVTGASGFIGAHCVNQLLLKGYNVNGTIRGDPSSDKYKWLYQLGESKSVKLFQANLLTPNSFDAAIKNCDYVFHVASPVKLTVDDFKEDLLEPAKNGTINVLKSCLKHKLTVKRVVLTSSLYAVYGIPKPNKIYDETDWDDDFTLETQPYAYSKTEAERAAWQFMKKVNGSFDLVSILPSLVIGGELNKGGRLTASNVWMYNFLKSRMGKVNIIIPLVDVRDIAAAHVFLIDNEKALKDGNGRYCCWGNGVLMSYIYDEMDRYCMDREIKSPMTCCKTCCKCDHFFCAYFFKCCIVCCCVPKAYVQYYDNNVNQVTHMVSDEKIKRLGFKFRDIDTTLWYTWDYFLDHQIVLK
eukprot:1060_1